NGARFPVVPHAGTGTVARCGPRSAPSLQSVAGFSFAWLRGRRAPVDTSDMHHIGEEWEAKEDEDHGKLPAAGNNQLNRGRSSTASDARPSGPSLTHGGFVL